MKVGEQAIYLAQLKGLSVAEAKKELKIWFEKFDITSWWNKKVEDLSKGMAQKIQFIVTIIHKPELLIFDEPFSGFDPINVNLLKKEILNLRDNGTTIIFSTHNMASVEEVCDNIALINNAETILEGKVEDIKNTYKQDIFRVEAQGDLGLIKQELERDFEWIDTNNKGADASFEIKLKENQSANDLIKAVLRNGELRSFNEVLPSMNEIFIRMVEGKH